MVLERLIFKTRLEIILVRTPEDLCRCDALIIPGGGISTLTLFPSPFIHVLYLESTAIALLARLSGVLEPLREFVKQKPVWGTCAGAILLSQAVKGAKKGGQELLGGMSITIARNGWGSQVLRIYSWCISSCLTTKKLDRIFWSWIICARTSESWAAVYRIIHPCSSRWLYYPI